MPATVTFSAGQTTSAVFDIDAVDDAIVDGTQTVTITASAVAHTDGTDTVDVTDDGGVVPQIPGDVDGDDDFNANDSFLIQLVKLSGTDAQINQSKGTSQLSATAIRANVNALGVASPNQSAAGGSQVLVSVLAAHPERDRFFADDAVSGHSPVAPAVAEPVDDVFRDAFRKWIDAI